MIAYKVKEDGSEEVVQFMVRKGDYAYEQRMKVVKDCMEYLSQYRDGYASPASLAQIMIAYWEQYKNQF